MLIRKFVNVCEWFFDNKLSIHIGEDKTKFVLCRMEINLQKINVKYGNNGIKQFCISQNTLAVVLALI